MTTPRISYVDLSRITDPAMLAARADAKPAAQAAE
jgi:hypothetical protein